MVKVGVTAGQLLDIELLGVTLKIPPVNITLFNTEWITKGVEGLFAPMEDIWKYGDANRDHVIDDADKALVEAAFGSRPGDPRWNPDCDFNQDGVITISDTLQVSKNYGMDRRGGTVTQFLMTSIQTLLSGIVSPITTGVWNYFERTLDAMAADYYERHSEEKP